MSSSRLTLDMLDQMLTACEEDARPLRVSRNNFLCMLHIDAASVEQRLTPQGTYEIYYRGELLGELEDTAQA